jgi:alpha-tubulin suppressor-like RCC1 family protein
MARLIYFLMYFTLLLSCSDNPVTGGAAGATIYMPDEHTPAEGATITVFNAGRIGERPVCLSITDGNGRFSLENISPGRYCIWGRKDSLVLFQDSIEVTSELFTLRDDTLEYPSLLTGRIAVDLPHDPGLVTVGLAGAGKKCTIADTGGRFTLPDLAGGNYVLFIESTFPGYPPAYRTVHVASHSHDTITEPIRYEYDGIPYVKGIRITQDTLAGTITISWKKPSWAKIQDYLVYRDVGPVIDLSAEPVFATDDTSLVDSIFSTLVANTNDTAVRRCKYRIALRTINQEIGPTDGYRELGFAPKSLVTTWCTHAVRYRGKVCDAVSIGDTVTFFLTAKNMTRPLEKLIWYDFTGQDTIAKVELDDRDTAVIIDSVNYSFSDTGLHTLHAILIDGSGTEWVDVMTVRNVIDTLAAFAGNDTGVFTEGNIRLHGDAVDEFGEITMWKWKIGSGDWTETSGPDTVFSAPAGEELLVCSLAVTDEDGAGKQDELLVMSSLPVKDIAGNGVHSLILKSDGGLWTCGSNKYGQLGDGTLTDRLLPVRIMDDVHSMAAGFYHTLIVKTDGSLWACGDNSNGQFGNGTIEGHITPNRIMGDVQSVAANNYYSLILKTDGTLLGCGWRNSESAEVNGYLPVMLMNDVQSMAAGVDHLLILKTDGTLWTCGKNNYGQLGDGTKTDRFVPAQVMTGVKSVAANGSHSMILKTDGTFWTCGLNFSAQLGYYGYSGSTRSRSTPVQIMTDVRSMAAGWNHSLIVKTDETLWASGYNSSYGYAGQFGIYTNRFAPTQIMEGVQQVAAGPNYSLIVKTDGSLWACGENDLGQLGNGRKTFQAEPIRVVPYLYHGISIRQMDDE